MSVLKLETQNTLNSVNKWGYLTISNQKFILSYPIFRALKACFTLLNTQRQESTNKQKTTIHKQQNFLIFPV